MCNETEADELVDNDCEEAGEMIVGFGGGHNHVSTTLSEMGAVGKSTVHGSDLTKQRFWALLKVMLLSFTVSKYQDKKIGHI